MKFGAFYLSQAPAEALTPAEALRQELGQMQLAEDLGFDSVWLAEHHQSRYCVAPDAVTYAAHVAAITSRVRVGLAVAVLPLRNPLDFAERAAFVDVLSGGRLDVGVGRGYSKTEFQTLGLSLDGRRERFEEALDIVRRAWTEDGFGYEGKFWNFRNVSIEPKPLQRPHPPLFFASSGSPDTMRSIAARGLPFMFGDDFLTPDKVADRLRTFRALSVEAGHSRSETEDAIGRSWLMLKVHLRATSEEAREFAAPYLLWRYQMLHNLLPSMSGPTLGQKLRKRAPVLKHVINSPEDKDPSEVTGDDLTAFDLIGTPDDCIEQIQAYKAAGMRNVICSFSFGGMPDADVRRSMGLFAWEVMPVLKGVGVYG